MSDGRARPYLSVTERRAVLLDAAVAVLRDGGVEALSLRTVADRAGVAHRVVSYAFGSKAELVAALLLRETSSAVDAAWTAPMADPGFEPSVEVALTAYAAVIRADPRLTESLAALTASARLSPELREAAQSEAALARDRVHALVTDWAGANPGSEIDVDRAVTGIHAAAEGITGWWLATRDDDRLPDVIRAFTAGIAAAARR
ncbi:helix-turn-helix domain-containing protein [Microbacterium sp. NPDC077184]|uniref:TetR/AcrR family transcriptional regulator n=1 Tax=Microbacterium sp. NPDC077184 TaxID=3154764 RepID=UPI0034337C13